MILAAPDTGEFRLDELQRALARAIPTASLATAGAPPLELSRATDPPVLERAELLEDAALRARDVGAAPEAPFAAFLDGTQRSAIVGHVDGVPIVSGVTAAVVREWAGRAARTWGHQRRHRLYAPRAALRDADWEAVAGLGVTAIDTSAGDASLADAHPTAHRDAAIARIQRDREQLEQQLARRWCGERDGALYVDGGLRGSVVLADAAQTVGVVKSHHTLFGDRAARRVIYALPAGQRSSAFLIASPGKVPVASWYLRLRDPAGHGPLWGLVRVEVRHEPGAAAADVAGRAGRISRRILGEREPVALPDARWDTMVYGIRDCEVFLKATQ
ncbi:MAG: hypothetical protein B7Z72_03430 [Gemmatimonadetes bacterium 21-71-4]|nr:MAG: hypothetical protein B7Z72_03430 [Gemmatimonadetes bacterium 21-71-4]